MDNQDCDEVINFNWRISMKGSPMFRLKCKENRANEAVRDWCLNKGKEWDGVWDVVEEEASRGMESKANEGSTNY